MIAGKHGYFAFEKMPFFHAGYGLIAFIFVVLSGKQMRNYIMRSEDYYDAPYSLKRTIIMMITMKAQVMTTLTRKPTMLMGAPMIDFLTTLPPGTLMMLGGLLIPLVPKKSRAWAALLLPVLSFFHLLGWFSDGYTLTMEFLGLKVMPIRVDRLALIFGYIFHIAAFLSGLYALKVKDPIQHLAGMVYAGAAITAVFAGDLITLFVFWELTAISSVFLIWASRTEESLRCGVRYLVIQVASGVILLAGALMHYADTSSLGFTNFVDGGLLTTATTVMLWAIGIKAAFPFLHNWLQDAYPKATYSGTVFLSAFTTKLAIYALARGYAGFEFLIPIGCLMTIFPIFFAVIENDLRKVLAYSLITTSLALWSWGLALARKWRLTAPVPMPLLISSTKVCCLWQWGRCCIGLARPRHQSLVVCTAICLTPPFFASLAGCPSRHFRFLRFCRQVSDRLCSRSPGAGVCHLCASFC